jgi:DNA-binding NarL/FixJ family response regulator
MKPRPLSDAERANLRLLDSPLPRRTHYRRERPPPRYGSPWTPPRPSTALRRAEILRMLRARMRQVDIARELQISKEAVNHHVKVLKAAGAIPAGRMTAHPPKP